MSNFKSNVKKIIAVFCVLTVMQSYFYALKNVALAVEEELAEEAYEENYTETEEYESENFAEEETIENIDEEQIEYFDESEEVIEEEGVTEETVDEEVEQETEQEEIVEETGNPQVDSEMSSKNSSIYKGYLYANATSDLKYETVYNSTIKLTLYDTDYIDGVVFRETDKIGLGEEVDLNLDDYIYYKTTKVSQEEFDNILGTEGSIKLYDGYGNYIDEITSETEVENGYYVYTYADSYNNVMMQIMNPINDGDITILNDKAITGDLIYTREQISLFESINTYLNLSMISGAIVKTLEDSYSINLEETESKMTIEIDNNTLSTESENEISLNIALKTDEERYDLFENPVVEIEFPAAVSSVEINSVNLLYKNGLSLSTWNTYTNENGNVVLRVEMTGNQLVYTPGSVTEGTNIAIEATVTVYRLTSNGTQNLKMTYTNEGTDRISYILDGNDAEYLTLNFTGKEQIITATSVTNQTNGSSSLTYESKTAEIDIEAEEEGQTILVTGTLIDNFSSTITNTYIIGKIPFNGNVNAEGNSYGTTFDASLASVIETSGLEAIVYYSEEENPDVDSESWTTDTSDITKYKTYKIVINNEEINSGDNLSFSYNIYVPENIGYNAVGYGDYTIYYLYDEQEHNISNTYKLASEEKELTLNDVDESTIVEVTASASQEESNQVIDDENVSGETSEEETDENEEIEENNVDKENNSNEENNNNEEENYSDDENNNEEDIEESDDEEIKDNSDEEETLLSIGYKVTQGTTDLTAEDTVYERQIVKYTVVIENTSDITINNLVVKGNAENANMYTYVYYTISDLISEPFDVRNMEEITDGSITYDELDIDSLAPGESAIFSYYVITLEKESDKSNLTGNITVSSDEIEEQTVQTFSNEIIDAEVSVILKTNGTEGMNEEDYVTGGVVEFEIYFKNIADYDLENFVIVLEYSNGFYFEEPTSDVWFEGSENYNYYTENNGSSNNLVFEIPYLEKGKDEGIYIRLCTNSVDIDVNEITYTLMSYAETSGNKYYSNDFTRTYSQGETDVEFTWSSDTNKETLYDGDTITFIFQMENIGTIDATFTITPYFSEGYRFESASYTINGGESIDVSINNNSIFISDELNVDDKIVVTIVANVNKKDFSEDQNVLESRLSVTGDKYENFFTDVISYKISNSSIETVNDESENDYSDVTQYSQNNYNYDTTVSSDGSTISSANNSISDDVNYLDDEEILNAEYTISGIVWLDSDKDGIKNGEDGIENINVILYETDSAGNIDISKKISETTTNNYGKYSFENIESGSYVVIFEYDNEIYAVTEYQNSKATQSENSNATSKTLTDGEIIAITDVLEISNSNLANVNLGLVLIKTFDFSLKQYISKISVTNNNEKNDYKYNDEKETKIEISQKYYTSTILEITYKLVITNEGDVAGCINKIINYLPKEAILYDSNWNEGNDNIIYNTQLLGSEIQPGDSRTINLTVKVSLENGEALKIENIAEIAESTNSYGLSDIDSVTNNKDSNEDDYAMTSIIISISTGLANSVVVIISCSSCIVICILVCIYRKKYYNKKRFEK